MYLVGITIQLGIWCPCCKFGCITTFCSRPCLCYILSSHASKCKKLMLFPRKVIYNDLQMVSNGRFSLWQLP